MSSIETKIMRVRISEHPKAERLQVATVGSAPGEGGFECVVGKGQFADNDLAIYIMPDSVIPDEMNTILAERNKIQIKGGRIRPINIRGLLSEGLCLTPSEWLDHPVKEDDDVTEELEITKYEPPPPPNRSALRNAKGINFNYQNENFKKYYCVEKFKKCPGVLAELGQDVVITKKIHGCNARYGLVTKPVYKKSWWEVVKSWFVKEDSQEFLVGSHDKIKKPSPNALKYGDYYSTDTWWKIAQTYDLQDIVNQIADHEQLVSPTNKKLDVVIYGEIFGEGVQKNYFYGFRGGVLGFEVFDIMIDGKFCDWDKVVHICKCFNLKHVDELYRGPWSLELTKMAEAVDVYDGVKHNREGIVIRPVKEAWHRKCGRVIFKFLNPLYLLDKTNSEHH